MLWCCISTRNAGSSMVESIPVRFNVRVYGLLLIDNHLLINKEIIHGREVVKLPGGGLELGEGLKEGLKREFKEELGIDIEVGHHFYTTDFFQASAFDDSQVISIYYWVKTELLKPFTINNLEPNEQSTWLPFHQLSPLIFTLPIDKVVVEKLRSLTHL